MRCVGGVAAAALLAVGALDVCVGEASAAPAGDDREENRFLFFAGTDLWRHGSFTHGGLLWSPSGLDHEGFTLKLLIGGGGYRYQSGALDGLDVDGRQFNAFALPGWRFNRGNFSVTVFAGLDIQHHGLSPDDVTSGLRGTSAGLRGGFDLWFEPIPMTMLAADVSASTIGPSYAGRAAFGWRIFNRFYAGPEVQGFSGDGNYHQIRAGMHVTAFKIDTLEWSAAAGWALDSDHRSGLYGRIGLIARR